jgi:hypothetical protein
MKCRIRQPVLFAAGLHIRVHSQIPFKQLQRFAEFRRRRAHPCFLMLLEEIHQAQFGGCPDRGSQAFTNQLAAHLDSAIVIAAVDVLQLVRHFGKRTPFSIRGNVFFPFAAVLRNVPYGFHNSKSTGYNYGIQRQQCRNRSCVRALK